MCLSGEQVAHVAAGMTFNLCQLRGKKAAGSVTQAVAAFTCLFIYLLSVWIWPHKLKL